MEWLPCSLCSQQKEGVLGKYPIIHGLILSWQQWWLTDRSYYFNGDVRKILWGSLHLSWCWLWACSTSSVLCWVLFSVSTDSPGILSWSNVGFCYRSFFFLCLMKWSYGFCPWVYVVNYTYYFKYMHQSRISRMKLTWSWCMIIWMCFRIWFASKVVERLAYNSLFWFRLLFSFSLGVLWAS